MTAVERKIVHLRLKELDGVETTSEGTEPNRYVVVTSRCLKTGCRPLSRRRV